MPCNGCQPVVQIDQQKNETIKKAQELANRSGEWYAIYKEEGKYKTIRADKSIGLPVEQFISSKLQNSNV